MSRTAKIAVAGALGGLLMALTLGMARREDHRVETVMVPGDELGNDGTDQDLRRCRTLTMPDSGCEAAWEEKRRRFFGREDRP
jgi:conjugative transfer region protein TrbK